jgi:radical SAM protein with 4Fe4S-binding SPASM domain
MSDLQTIDENQDLKSTELTAVIGREKFDLLANVVGQKAWDQYRNEYAAAANLEVITDYPLQIDFELNASCNLRCPMCPISAESPKGKGKNTWFSIDLYKQIVSDGVKRGLRAIKLNYVNEPLNRNDLFEFIRYAREAGVIDVYLSTNGMLMTPKVIRQLIEAGLTRIQISIDAHTEGVYDQIRPGGKLQTVQKNVEKLMAIRNELNSVTPLVRVNFVRTELNEHQLKEFMSFWKDRVDMIGIQEYVKPPVASGKLISLTTEHKRVRGFRCSFPFKQLVITNEQNILPCCTFWGEHLKLAKCDTPESVSQAWNSDKIKQLRQIHKNGEYWKVETCRQCVEGGLVT